MRRDPRWHGARHASAAGGPVDPPQSDITVRDNGRDEAEFHALYDTHHDLLLAHVLRLTGGDSLSAEEIVTEAVLRAWRDPARRDRRPAAVRPWLIVLARSVHAERFGLARAEAGTDLSLLGGPVASSTIVSAMNELSGLHRGVLIDLFYRGTSVEQTAAALGVPVATVKSRLYYALRALRMVLQQQDR